MDHVVQFYSMLEKEIYFGHPLFMYHWKFAQIISNNKGSLNDIEINSKSRRILRHISYRVVICQEVYVSFLSTVCSVQTEKFTNKQLKHCLFS